MEVHDGVVAAMQRVGVLHPTTKVEGGEVMVGTHRRGEAKPVQIQISIQVPTGLLGGDGGGILKGPTCDSQL